MLIQIYFFDAGSFSFHPLHFLIIEILLWVFEYLFCLVDLLVQQLLTLTERVFLVSLFTHDLGHTEFILRIETTLEQELTIAEVLAVESSEVLGMQDNNEQCL